MTRLPQPPARGDGDPAANESLRRAIAHAVARHEQRLMGLLDLARALSVRTAPEELVDTALLSLMGHVGSSRGAIWILDGDGSGDLRLALAHGADVAAAMACTEGLQAWCRRPIGDLPALALLDTRLGGLDDGTRSILNISGMQILGTFMVDSRVLGVMTLSAPAGGGTISSFDQHALHTALRMLAVAWDNAALYRALARRTGELEEANAELLELDRLRGEFIANVNHELRTPVAIVAGAVDCLRYLVPDGEETGHFIHMIEDQARRLGGQIQGLLDFGNLSSGSQTIERQPMDLRSLVAATLSKHRVAVAKGERNLEARTPEEPVVADSDPLRIAAILDQLVGNAVKFTPPGTTIRIETAAETADGTAWACVRVSDDGPGIDPRVQERIFRPFVQGDGSSTRRAGGMGLGLALARTTSEKLGGALLLESEPGRGATFTLRLPVWRPAAGEHTPGAPDAAAA